MKAYCLVFLALIAGCGRISNNPYEGAQSFPLSSTFVCTNAVLGDNSITKFAGAIYCSAGQIFFSNDRYTALAPLAAGTYTKEQVGLLCGFTVDASCVVSAITF